VPEGPQEEKRKGPTRTTTACGSFAADSLRMQQRLAGPTASGARGSS
jgi:hypothetical protein